MGDDHALPLEENWEAAAGRTRQAHRRNAEGIAGLLLRQRSAADGAITENERNDRGPVFQREQAAVNMEYPNPNVRFADLANVQPVAAADVEPGELLADFQHVANQNYPQLPTQPTPDHSVQTPDEFNRNDETCSYLFELVQEGRPCSSNNTNHAWSDGGCNGVVQQCRGYPKQAKYRSLHERSPLHEACLRNSCRHVIRALLSTHEEAASQQDSGGNTPLHLLFAEYSSHYFGVQNIEEATEELLKASSLLQRNEDDNSALHMACMASGNNVSTSVISYLIRALDSEAIPPVFGTWRSCAAHANGKHQTPLLLLCKQPNANIEIAQILLEVAPNTLTNLDADGWAPMHYAAANANVDMLQYLVSSFPDETKLCTSKNESPLHVLCRLHRKLSSVGDATQWNAGSPPDRSAAMVVEAAKILLSTHPTLVTMTDSRGQYTPLHLLCKGGNSAALKQLVQLLLDIDPSAVNISDQENYLPLHHACEVGCDSEIVRMLLTCGVKTAQALTRKRDTALSLACTSNTHVDTVKLLVEAFPDALSLKNNYGFAPLHCICRAHLPRTSIVQVLLDACPSSILFRTNGGETPVHLFSSNRGASAGILHLMTRIQNEEESKRRSTGDGLFAPIVKIAGADTADLHADYAVDKVGNTPLHDACFRETRFEQIETLVLSNREWVAARNKAGFTPLQILCKNGRLDEQLILLFFTAGGASAFSVMDSNHNTPLHSSIRQGMVGQTLKCLVRANPDALLSKTLYGDTPLHLACFRKVHPDIVCELAASTSCGNASLLLLPNVGGETPIGIALEQFHVEMQSTSRCYLLHTLTWSQQRAFEVLSCLVKILHYGPIKCQNEGMDHLNLLHASLALHRRGIFLDPVFIRRAIHLNPNEAFVADEHGDFALHIEASIPVEKMPILDGKLQCGLQSCCGESCKKRSEVLSLLLKVNPGAAKQRNGSGHFPLGLMINSGRKWSDSNVISAALKVYPAALHWYKELDGRTLPLALERIGRDCGVETVFPFLRSRPSILEKEF